jgi:hypothetical protein
MAETLREVFNRNQRKSLAIAAVAGIATLVGAVIDSGQFFQSYLLAFLFWLSFPLGSLAIIQLHHLTGGSWGMPIRRLLEAATRTLPHMALLFLPIAFGLHSLYQWSRAEVVAADPILQHKSLYLNVPFFLARAALYFAVWIGVATVQSRLASRQDKLGGPSLAHRMRKVAGPGIGLYALCMSFAAFDWGMSLEPHWFSTIYGVVFIIGQGVATLAFSIVAATWLSGRQPFARWVNAGHFHDLGKLLFAFVMLWAYVNFSQFLIVWSGNLAEETPWYLNRIHGGWREIALFLVVFHFALPFAALLSAKVKRNPRALVTIAFVLIFLRWVDLFWWIVPTFHPGHFHIHWLDVSTTIAVGGLWFGVFVQQAKGRPLISLQDAHLEGLLEAPAEAPA